MGSLVTHVHDAFDPQLMRCFLSTQNVGSDVVCSNPGHLLGHMAGLWEIHRYRSIFHRWQGDGDTNGINVAESRVAVMLIDGNKSLRISKARRLRDGPDASQWWNDQRKRGLEYRAIRGFNRFPGDRRYCSRYMVTNVTILKLRLQVLTDLAKTAHPEMAKEGLGRDEGHRRLMAQLAFFQFMVGFEQKLIRGSQATGARRAANDHRAGVFEEGGPGVMCFFGFGR